MSRPVIWALAFAGLALIFAVLLPISHKAELFEPIPLAVWGARVALRLTVVGFGAALVVGARARPRGSRRALDLAVLAASAALAALFAFPPLITPAWQRPLSGLIPTAWLIRLAEVEVALIPVALVWLGAVIYEIVAWGRSRRRSS